ncbi:MAG: DUF2283 domain-containing protein [Deferrisomatales bacterium]|nr:DUF2283 domain-containing protein [Deferrisomatales bacterium]
MAEVKVLYDEIGNTLTVWFGNPADECVCEETGEEVILIKDKAGRVIGFEKLNYVAEPTVGFQVGFQTAGAIAAASRQERELDA